VGVFDSLKGMAKDAMEAGTTAAGGAEATGAAHEESAVAKLLGAGGGQLPAILEKLNVGGLGDVAKSWIGKGQDEAAAKIAQYLPTIIDKLTPDGLVPDPDALAKKVSGLLKL
jgi:uncharacterized protein YidB (DUF937 family)